ncbi:MAG: hypothetical protein PHY09_09735 [Desulfuromonadaceae bacterium]|nr:hypothetical protein [Desulfuromonadaceae bacterium]MDD5105820.1 hypothetical protein [Desulfuromonadaceae bacterium]
MNIRIFSVALLSVFILGTNVKAEDGFGLGVILGEPTGISVKKWLGADRAVDAAAAWSFTENDSFQFHADYLFHNFGLLRSADLGGRIPVYFGFGGRLKLQSHDHGNGRNDHDALLGVRIPVGISYMFSKAPVDLFVELVPILDLAPSTDLGLNGAIGARFYFR